MLLRHLKQQTEQLLKGMVKFLELRMQRVFMVLELVYQHPRTPTTSLLLQLKQQRFLNSMTVLDGLQRNTILVRNKTLEGRPRVLGKLNPRKGLLLHSLAMCGMKHLVITMMRLLDTTTMEIQVGIYLYCYLFL
jgi:hypothetical protein